MSVCGTDHARFDDTAPAVLLPAFEDMSRIALAEEADRAYRASLIPPQRLRTHPVASDFDFDLPVSSCSFSSCQKATIIR